MAIGGGVPWRGEDEGMGGRPIKLRPQKARRKPKAPAVGSYPQEPLTEHQRQIQRTRAAEEMKAALTQADFPGGGEGGIAGPEGGLAFLMDPSQYPGGFTSPEFTGSAGVGPVGLSVVAGQGVGRLLTKKMVKDLPTTGAMKGVADIPKSLIGRINQRARKLFGKDPKDLNKVEAQSLFTDLVDKKGYKPVAPVRKERSAVRTEAEAKTATAQRARHRTEESAGIEATLRGEKKAATAAGSPAVEVGEGAARTRAPRAARREEGDIKGATARASAKEDRETAEALKGQVSRQAEPRAAAPSMAGEKLTPEQIAGVSRKAVTRAGKKELSEANKRARDIGNAAKGVDNALVEVDVKAAQKQLDTLEATFGKIKDTASPEKVKTAQAQLTKLRGRIANANQKAAASAKEAAEAAADAKLQQAATRKAAAQAAEPKDPAAAQASYTHWESGLDAKDKMAIGKRAAELAKKPWDEMVRLERRNFIHKAMQERKFERERRVLAGDFKRGATPAPKAEPAKIKSDRRKKAAEEVAGEVVEEVTEAAPRPTGRARIEKRAKQAAGATVSGVAGGAAGGYVGGPVGAGIGAMAGPAVVEAAKRAPWTTGLGLTAAGVGGYYATDAERDEAKILEKTTGRTVEKRQKQREEKKVDVADAATKKARTDELNKKQWYGVALEFDEQGNPANYPSNWIDAYHKFHAASAEAIAAGKKRRDPYFRNIAPSAQYEKNSQMPDGPDKIRAMANHMREVVGQAKAQGHKDVLDVQYDETGTPQDFDVKEILKVIYRVGK